MSAALAVALATMLGLNLPVETLDGNSRAFPRDAAEPRSVFVVTFSKYAAAQGSDWTRKLTENQDRLSATVFQVAVVEDVPRLFRSFVVSALARGIPDQLHDRFWIAVTATADWQHCVDSTATDEPHVFVLDQRERIVWQGARRSFRLEASGSPDARPAGRYELRSPQRRSSPARIICFDRPPRPAMQPLTRGGPEPERMVVQHR